MIVSSLPTIWWLLSSPCTQSCRSVIVSTSKVGERRGREARAKRQEKEREEIEEREDKKIM